MPAAIPLAVGLGATAAAGGAIAAGTATFLGLSAAVWSGISVGLSVVGTVAQTLLQETPDKPKMQDGDVSIKQAIPPRTRLYGRQRLGGVFLYYDSTSDGDLKTLICHCAHEVDGWEEDWLNDERVQLDGDGNVLDDPWWQEGDDDSVVVIKHYAGSPTQVIPSFDPKWTAAHKAHGLCCSYVKYADLKDEEQIKVFPSGPPPYRAVLRGAKIYDPRPAAGQTAGQESSYTWSDNAALVILDYLTRTEEDVPVGFGIPFDRIDLGSFAAAADVCDQSIPKKGGGTEPRWRAWGAYELTEDRKAVLQDLLDTCGGRLIQGPDGRLGLSVGAGPYRAAATDPFTVPAGAPAASVVLNDDQILEFDFSAGKSAIERINEVRATYVSQEWEWAETEAGIQLDQEAQDRNGVESSQIKLRFVPSESQAQRVARYTLKHGNPKWSGRIRTTLAGLDAWGERWVRLQLAELGIDQIFEVTSMRLDRTTMTVEMDVQSYDGWWDWTAATDEADPAVPPPDTDDSSKVPVPQHVAVAIEHRAISSQTYAAIGVISWDPPPRSVYVGRARYRPVTTPSSAWQLLYAEQDENTVSTPPLIDGQGYEAQARFIGSRGSPGDWSPSALFTAVADPIAPASPINLTAQANVPTTGQVTVTATQPNDPRAASLRFYRNSSNVFPGGAPLAGPYFAGPGATRSFVDTPGAGDWWYFATSSNWSNVPSAPAGGVLAEVAPPAPVITTPPATIGQTNPTVSGTSVAGASIKVFANGVLNTTTTADGSGNWSAPLISLGSGTQSITATATVAGNESAASGSVTLTVVWYDPDASGHADFRGNRARLIGADTTLAALFDTITTSPQIVTMASGALKSIAANALPLSDLGLELWEARTNRCTNWNAAPTGTANLIKEGDAASVLSVVDDSTTLNAGILADLVSAGVLNGNVIKLDNSAGTTEARVGFSGMSAGADGTFAGSAYIRGGTGRIMYGISTVVASFGASATYRRVVGTASAVTANAMRITADPGQIVYFVLNQMEAGAFATAPIVVAGAVATRAAPVIQRALGADFNTAEGFIGTRSRVATGVAGNGVVLAVRAADTSNRHYLQWLGTTTLRSNVQVGGANTGGPIDRTGLAGTSIRQAVYGFKANDFALAVDGAAPGIDSSGAVPTGTPAVLRISDSGPLNGVIEQIKWGTTKPSNSTIQAKSGWTLL